jgi:hypothetical protein
LPRFCPGEWQIGLSQHPARLETRMTIRQAPFDNAD